MVIGGKEEKERRMPKGKEKVEEDEKTTSFVLFGCRIKIRDSESTKECVRGSSSGSNRSITSPQTDSHRRHSNFHMPHPFTSTSTNILLPLFHDSDEDKKKKRKRVQAEGHPYGWKGVIHDMGATELTPISTKNLTISDTEERQNRLLLPKQHLLPMLTLEEEERLSQDGIPAIIVDREGRRWATSFNYWKTSKSYNLNGDWTKLVETCGLSSPRDRVEVKAFRHGGQERRLGFVVLHPTEDVDTELKL